MLTIELKKKHFKGNEFYSFNQCPIARVLRERYPNRDISVGTHYAAVGMEKRELKDPYLFLDYADDKELCRRTKSPEAVIRRIVFI